VSYGKTLTFEIAIKNITSSDELVRFDVKVNGKPFLTSEATDHQMIAIRPSNFINETLHSRLKTSFSKPDQKVTLWISNITFEDDGLQFKSKLVYSNSNDEFFKSFATTNITVKGRSYMQFCNFFFMQLCNFRAA